MPDRKNEKPTQYEAPRLQTYGKLQDLTRGGGSISADALGPKAEG